MPTPLPAEDQAIRPGSTRGRPFVARDGSSWHLPRVDDSIIPLLPRIATPAYALVGDFLDLRNGGGAVPSGMPRRSLDFLRLVLGLQYDLTPEQLRDLIEAITKVEGNPDVGVLHDFLDDLSRFMVGRIPDYSPHPPWRAGLPSCN